MSCGTGGTAAGMVSALGKDQYLIGFSALKGDFMEEEIRKLVQSVGEVKSNWSVNTDFHFGGYAKFDPMLIQFINDFKREFDIRLDPIYTGKLLYGVFELVKKEFFPKGTNVMIVHTGGIQGIAGFNERFEDIIQQALYGKPAAHLLK